MPQVRELLNAEFHFGQWVRQRRKSFDLTQQGLAEEIGCSKITIVKIERGERRPSRQLCELLAQRLKIPEDQRELFIKAARMECLPERLAALSPPVWSEKMLASRFRLPSPTTPLIGRQRELAEIEKTLLNPQCRLLTLLGLGGIGKTRLAIEAAIEQKILKPEQVVFVDLTPLHSPKFIVQTIANSFGSTFSGTAVPIEQLLIFLSGFMKEDYLLILDNLESLLHSPENERGENELIVLVEAMLRRLPRLKILATSRERLNLQSEWVFELQGLPVPPTVQLAHLERYSSAALFLEAAKRAQARFDAKAEDQSAIAHICQMVEGMPLAIELAATWVDVLSCREIEAEIERNLNFLTSDYRDLPARQRSLQAVFDHSWNLLNEEERMALCRLSVFRGEFHRDVAAKIAGTHLHLLSALMSKSLMSRNENGRYHIHEMIRQFAAETLRKEPDLLRNVYTKHGRYYLTLLNDREGKVMSASQPEAIAELSSEIENLRAAWQWAIENREIELIQRALRCFWWFYDTLGWFQEAARQFEAVNQMLKNHASNGSLAENTLTISRLAAAYQAWFAFRLGHFQEAVSLLEFSSGNSNSAADADLIEPLLIQGVIAYMVGDYPDARQSVEKGLQLACFRKDLWFIALGHSNLGIQSFAAGDYTEAARQMRVGLDIWRQIGDPRGTAFALSFYGLLLITLGELDQAEEILKECLDLSTYSRYRVGTGIALQNLGHAALARGRLDEACTRLQESIGIFDELEARWDLAHSYFLFGEVQAAAGQISKARDLMAASLRLAAQSQAVPTALDALLGIANLQVDPPEKIRQWAQLALHHPATIAVTRNRAQKLLLALNEQTDFECQSGDGFSLDDQNLKIIVNEILSSESRLPQRVLDQ